jgi:uncharacterized membrane protein
LSPAEPPRLTAATALGATVLVGLAWLGPPAARAGAVPVTAVLLVVLPLLFGLRGLLLSRLRTGRWLSLVLPFYGAGFLVAAVGNPEARGWVTAGAFCVALAFAATLSWVKRATPAVPPR